MQLLVFIIAAVKLSKIAAEYYSQDVLLTASEINKRFSTQTNVIFNFDDTPTIETRSSELGIPNIIITHPANFKLIYQLDKSILAIAHISANSAAVIQASLSQVLSKMRHVNVLFVLLDSTNPHPIFQWAWENGFKNSIALFWTEEGRKQLSEYQPFPKLNSINISSITESRLQKPMTNLNLHPMRIPLLDDPPLIFRYLDAEGKVIHSGAIFKVFQLFAKHYNTTIEEVILPHPYPDGDNYFNYVSAIKAGTVDIGTVPMPQFFDFFLYTDTFFYSSLYLMVPVGKPVEEYMYIVLPFQTFTWIGVLGINLLFATAICFEYRRASGEWDLSRALLQTLSGVLNIAFPLKIFNSRSVLLIYVLLSVAGIMLTNMYLAQHSTFLTTFVYEKQINTYEDVLASDLPIFSAASGLELCKVTGCSEDILEKVQVVNIELYNKLRRSLNASVITIIDDIRYDFFSFQQYFLRKKLVKIIKKPLVSVTPAFSMPLTSPYVSMYSNFNLKMFEAGLYKKFHADAIIEAMDNGLLAFIKSDTPEVSPLSVNRFNVAWILLSVGYALATVCFVIELVCFKLRS